MIDFYKSHTGIMGQRQLPFTPLEEVDQKLYQKEYMFTDKEPQQ